MYCLQLNMLYSKHFPRPKRSVKKRLKKKFILLLVLMIPDSVSIIFNKRLKFLIFNLFLLLMFLIFFI